MQSRGMEAAAGLFGDDSDDDSLPSMQMEGKGKNRNGPGAVKTSKGGGGVGRGGGGSSTPTLTTTSASSPRGGGSSSGGSPSSAAATNAAAGVPFLRTGLRPRGPSFKRNQSEEDSDGLVGGEQRAGAASSSLLPLAPQRPAEVEEGLHEHKLTLAGMSLLEDRRAHLSTQLVWRLREGGGEAIYHLGVSDDGTPVGVDQEEMDTSLESLRQMANIARAAIVKVTLMRGTRGPATRVAEVHLCASEDEGRDLGGEAAAAAAAGAQLTASAVASSSSSSSLIGLQVPIHHQHQLHHHHPRRRAIAAPEVRICVVGASLSGKSTLISVLTKGVLDDGAGSSRLHVMRHRHEVEDGKTRGWSQHLLGFAADGSVLGHGSGVRLSGAASSSAPAVAAGHHHPDILVSGALEPSDVATRATSLCTLLDSPGWQPSNRRSVLGGLLGTRADAILLTLTAQEAIEATREAENGEKERLAALRGVVADRVELLRGLGTKVAVVVTHLDLLSKEQREKELVFFLTLLRGALGEELLVATVAVSCVTGEGIGELLAVLRRVEPHGGRGQQPVVAAPHDARFDIEEVFCIAGKTIIAGACASGMIAVGDTLLVGPLASASAPCPCSPGGGVAAAAAAGDALPAPASAWVQVTVCSIHRHRVAIAELCGGHAGTLHVSLRGGGVEAAAGESAPLKVVEEVTFARGMLALSAIQADTDAMAAPAVVEVDLTSSQIDLGAWRAGQRCTLMLSWSRTEVEVVALVSTEAEGDKGADGASADASRHVALRAVKGSRQCFLAFARGEPCFLIVGHECAVARVA